MEVETKYNFKGNIPLFFVCLPMLHTRFFVCMSIHSSDRLSVTLRILKQCGLEICYNITSQTLIPLQVSEEEEGALKVRREAEPFLLPAPGHPLAAPGHPLAAPGHHLGHLHPLPYFVQQHCEVSPSYERVKERVKNNILYIYV